MIISKFIYDLKGHPEPKDEELDGDIDRLLFIKGIEEPNFIDELDERDLIFSDSTILEHWIRRRFEPALLLLLLECNDNLSFSKSELRKMESHKTQLEKLFRCNFVRRRALQRASEATFDNIANLTLDNAILRLKKTMTYIAKTLDQNKPNYTLLNTAKYTPADISLYNYLKRIMVGGYKDFGLRAHVKQCDPIIQFMHQYATKNTHVIDVSREDPLATTGGQNSLVTDMTKPAMFAIGVFIFYLWRRDGVVSSQSL